MTYDELVDAIADDIDDTTGEYTAQIQTAILAAIRYCERETYWFNETRDETFVTVDGQQWYDDSDNDAISSAVRIHALYSEDSQGQRTMLRRETPEALETLSDNSAASGEPYAWTYFNSQIRLYPIPGAPVYTMRMQLGPYRLAPLSAGTDTNVWTEDALDMVKARGKYILAKDTLKDAAMAAEALNDYQDQHDALKRETSSRTSRGTIARTCF